MDDATLCSMLKRAAEQADSGYRFLDTREKAIYIGYDKLLEKAVQFAGAFSRMGIQAEDRIALILPTCPEFFYVFFGALLIGGIPVPLYPPVRLGRLEEYHRQTGRMLNISRARLVVTNKLIKRIIGRSVAKASPDLGIITVDKIKPAPFAFTAGKPDALALIQFSSGTTVDPKPVMLTHRQVIANIQAILKVILDAYPPESYGQYHSGVSWLPLYHDMGLIGCALLAVSRPADLTMIPPELFVARPAVWLRAISAYKSFISPAPNFAYSLCADKIRDKEIEGVDLSHWHIALNGAEPVTDASLEKFIERFAPYGFQAHALTPVYGLSEAALAVTFSDLKKRFKYKTFDPEALLNGRAQISKHGSNLVSVGKPLPGYQLEIRNQYGENVQEGIIGTLHVKGPSIMEAYDDNRDATLKILKNGWLNTGDKGFIWEGELYLYGREKDLIIIRGRNYAPQIIEMALHHFPGIRKGCVIAAGYVPEGDNCEKLIIFCERDKKGDKSGDKQLAQKASAEIAGAFAIRPESVIVMEPGTILRTSSGKLRRGPTLNQYLAGTLAPPKQVTIFRMAAEMMRSRIALGITS
ncbi:MAG: fatty acyl-AMP ligase [Deltaproteobacteria bacterium]|nr:fatty acyl-AMP ligase [Deltaproteobacteria bacterium]